MLSTSVAREAHGQSYLRCRKGIVDGTSIKLGLPHHRNSIADLGIELKIPFHCIVDRKRLAFSCYTSRRASLPRRGLWKCQKFDSLLLTLLLLKVIEVAAAVCCCCSNEVEKLCLSSSYASSSRLWIRRRGRLQKPFLSSLLPKSSFCARQITLALSKNMGVVRMLLRFYSAF